MLCREVFRKFEARITLPEVNAYRDDRDALNVVYKSLQGDAEAADISAILRELHRLVDATIATAPGSSSPTPVYDISKINFERLRQEFAHSPAQHTTVQSLKAMIERRLRLLITRNPLRVNFKEHYQRIVEDNNREKDRTTIERTFQELLRFMAELDQEEARALREELDEESLAIYDLLQKPDLAPAEIARVEAVAADLLTTLKATRLDVDQWRDREATRDAVRAAIFDYLYSDATGLPAAYTTDEIAARSQGIFEHMFYAYGDQAVSGQSAAASSGAVG